MYNIENSNNFFFIFSYLWLPRKITSKFSYLTLIYHASVHGLGFLRQFFCSVLCRLAGVTHSAGSSYVQDGFTHVFHPSPGWLEQLCPGWPFLCPCGLPSLRSPGTWQPDPKWMKVEAATPLQWVLGPNVAQHHFLCVLLLEASHEVSPIKRERKQTLHLVGEVVCAKEMGLIIRDIFEDRLPK